MRKSAARPGTPIQKGAERPGLAAAVIVLSACTAAAGAAGAAVALSAVSEMKRGRWRRSTVVCVHQ